MTKRFVTLTPLVRRATDVPFGDRMKKAADARGDLGARRSASEAEAKLSRAAPVPDEPAAAILSCAAPNDRAGQHIGNFLP